VSDVQPRKLMREKDVLQKAKYVSDFFSSKMVGNGQIVCPACNVEHTGRNAYSIGINLDLFSKTKEKNYYNLAYSVAKRVMQKLVPDPEHGKLVFLPGNHIGANQSNTVIDSGICTDMIATFLKFSKEINIHVEEAEIWQLALKDHIESYLREAVFEKKCLNQRAWGLTGLASYYLLTEDEFIRKLIKDALYKLVQNINNDSSFNYIIPRIKGSPVTGFSIYYYSRLLSFLFYCMDCINITDLYRDKLQDTYILLLDCMDFKGQKILDLEIKKIFFMADYEMGAASYDLFMLRFINNKFRRGSKRILDTIEDNYLQHIDSDGVKVNKFNTPNLLCDFVNNSDFYWYLRGLKYNIYNIESYKPGLREYSDAGILVETDMKRKAITISTDYSPSIGWGVRNGLKIIIEENRKILQNKGSLFKTIIEFIRNKDFFGLVKFFRRNYSDLKNIIYTSQFNLKYKESRTKYYFYRLKRFLFT
jgi:hypothetical protein